MANPLSKGWKYLMASFDNAIDENADPQVQINQAEEAAKKQHREIAEHAASIIGQQRQLEMKLNRLVEDQKKLDEQSRTAVRAADNARAQGDERAGAEYDATAEVIVSQLVAVENQIEDVRNQYEQAVQAADQAKATAKQSEARLQEQLSELTQLRSQAEHVEMQETNAKAMDSMGQFSQDDSVPTLDSVREKIESRYATALGAQELTVNTVNTQMQEIQAAGRDMAAQSRLEKIRSEMQGELSSAQDAPAELSRGSEPEDAEEVAPENAATDSEQDSDR
ncbi:PspA/IM30 family protein [Corynebacterium sp. TAE3-ERU30]|uniref:PspA/IM30 family protein n=1 Tax=Corynebacterium sp. TAE3-ERU30 TaxID=2849496 RepID=UPI001C493DA8|nr:PspA/IM30 family protein [Corynebacterium sp. TAE3-ERU30]MBV7282385.1 PspA/IM30 family protein [Corynebacterium sp. TAE3-ERU30]